MPLYICTSIAYCMIYMLPGESCGKGLVFLIAAAYLHDIGYAPSLKKTGFHPLDGACYIRSCGYERLASLAAHHFEAGIEAQLLGHKQELDTFPRECSLLADA